MPAWCAALLIGHGGDLVAQLKKEAAKYLQKYRPVAEHLNPSESQRRIDWTKPMRRKVYDSAMQTAQVVEEAAGLQSGLRQSATSCFTQSRKQQVQQGDAALALSPSYGFAYEHLRHCASKEDLRYASKLNIRPLSHFIPRSYLIEYEGWTTLAIYLSRLPMLKLGRCRIENVLLMLLTLGGTRGVICNLYTLLDSCTSIRKQGGSVNQHAGDCSVHQRLSMLAWQVGQEQRLHRPAYWPHCLRASRAGRRNH